AAPRTLIVQRTGDQFLAGAALAGDQDRGVRRSDARDQLAQPAHCGAVAPETTVVFANDLLQSTNLLVQTAIFHDVFQNRAEPVQVERFRQVIEGPQADRADGALN